MSGRNPAAALRAGAIVWKCPMSPAGFQARCFSWSPQLQARHAIDFPPTSNAKLDSTLNEIRNAIIIPSYLTNEQRKRVYSQRHRERLQNDPITMEIDGEVLRFRHVDRFQLPNTRQLFQKAMNEMETIEDLKLLPKLLEGLCIHAGRKLPMEEWVRIIRRTHLNDCLYIALECVAAPKKTGFRLVRSEVVNDLLAALQKDAIDSGFDKVKTGKMLAWSERIVDMLEDPANKPTGKEKLKWKRGAPLNRDPQILAARLHLAAALAVKHQGGKDVDGKVTKYADELVKLWPEGAGLFGLHEKDAYTDSRRLKYLAHPNQFLWYGSPILNGLNWAAQVVEDEALAQKLREMSSAVETEMQWALGETSPEGQDPTAETDRVPRGLKMHRLLFAQEGEGQAVDDATKA